MTRRHIIALLAACACSETHHFRRIVLSGEVVAHDEEESAPVILSAHHTWAGSGPLRHPMAAFESTQLDGLGAFEWIIDVPLEDDTEGLTLSAWLDRDSDGVLCAIDGATDEPAGAASIQQWPTYEATTSIVLDQPCAGPETLLPSEAR